MGAMALAQPAMEPPPQPAAEAPDAGSPAPAPAPRPPPPKPEPRAEPKSDAGTAPSADAGTPAHAAATATATSAPPHTNAPPALTERARVFFAALLAGEPGPMVQQAELPFFLEDKRLASVEQ